MDKNFNESKFGQEILELKIDMLCKTIESTTKGVKNLSVTPNGSFGVREELQALCSKTVKSLDAAMEKVDFKMYDN